MAEKSLNKEADAQRRLEEKLVKHNEKIDKQVAILNKKLAAFDKLRERYKNDKPICKLIPFDVFNNFKWISHLQERELAKQKGVRIVLFPYNPICGEMYYKRQEEIQLKHGITKDTVFAGNEYRYKAVDNDEDTATLNRFYWEYFTKANELISSIHDKEEKIKELKEKFVSVSKEVNVRKERAKRISDLYEQVPELAQFIDEIEKQQYEFYIRQNEKLKVAWEKYKGELEKLDAQYGSQWSARCNRSKDNGEGYAKYKKLEEIKPKQIVRTEEQLQRMALEWKISERALLAERITTEFGDVQSTELHIGADGNVNGMIYGTLKSAKIETIFAGGYNIQCLHTRLLVHEK